MLCISFTFLIGITLAGWLKAVNFKGFICRVNPGLGASHFIRCLPNNGRSIMSEIKTLTGIHILWQKEIQLLLSIRHSVGRAFWNHVIWVWKKARISRNRPQAFRQLSLHLCVFVSPCPRVFVSFSWMCVCLCLCLCGFGLHSDFGFAFYVVLF